MGLNRLGLTQEALDACPNLYSVTDYDQMAHAAVEWWKERVIEKLGQKGLDLAAKRLRQHKELLHTPDGLSKETKEIQEAFVMPQAIENLFAMATKDPDWPRSRPALLRAIVREFEIGVMGEFDASVKNLGAGPNSDFGCSLGSGDID